MMVVMVFEKNIQKFSSHTVSKLGGMFRMKKSSPREFFYVDMPVVKVYLRENLKISAI
jgi:hypothetical protein